MPKFIQKHTLLLSTLFSFMLLTPSLSYAEESELIRLQKWLLEFSSLLEDKTDTSAIYLQNYLQCMDDQQALRSSEKMDITELLNNALDSGNECSPLLNDWLKEITEQPPETLSDEEKRRLLEKSL